MIAVGAIAGSILGGLLVSADLLGTGWRPVFLVNVPFGLLVAVLVPRLVPGDDRRGFKHSAGRLDLAGLAVAVPAVFLVVLPLVLGHERGWPAWRRSAACSSRSPVGRSCSASARWLRWR